MKCTKCEADVLDVFKYCHRCGHVLKSDGEKPAKVVEVSQTFEQFRKSLSLKRQGQGKKDKPEKTKKKKPEIPSDIMIIINAGIMKLVNGELKPMVVCCANLSFI